MRRREHVFNRRRHLFDEATDACLHCGIHLQDAQTGEEGCRAAATNPPWYCGQALTVPEQVMARSIGLDRDEALMRKCQAIFEEVVPNAAGTATMSTDDYIARRNAVERAALQAALLLREGKTGGGR